MVAEPGHGATPERRWAANHLQESKDSFAARSSRARLCAALAGAMARRGSGGWNFFPPASVERSPDAGCVRPSDIPRAADCRAFDSRGEGAMRHLMVLTTSMFLVVASGA